MENITDVLDDMTNLAIDEKAQEKLDNKFESRTQVDIDEPYYKASVTASYGLQVTSIVLGFGFCLHTSIKFPQFSWYIFGICAACLGLLELWKRQCINKINEVKIINTQKKVKLNAKPYRVTLGFLWVVSIGTSVIGGPEIIHYYSSTGPLIQIDSLGAKFEREIAQISDQFTKSSSNAFSFAKQLHTQNNWRGSTSKEVRDEKAKLIVLGQQTDSSKISAILDFKKDKNKAIVEAEKRNEEQLKEHKDWCYNTGSVAILIAILLDLFVWYLIKWNYKHEYRKREENKNKKKLLEKTQVLVKHDGKEKEFKDKPIEYTLTDGTSKKTSIGKFINYVKNSSASRKEDLKPFFDSYYVSNYDTADKVMQEKLDSYLTIF